MLIYLQLIETEEDKSKFEIIYSEYCGLMYHTAYKLLCHKEDSEDAVHHAFQKIAENMNKIGDPLSSKTRRYVVVIAEHNALDVLRHRRCRQIISFDDAEVMNGIRVDVDYDCDDTLARCILQLPAKQRHVIWLKYYHGYNLIEIAQILNITYASASKLDQRAKHKLREMYEEEGGEAP